MNFWKYHALGNDYLVMDGLDDEIAWNEKRIRTLCHRNFGVGSDGILLQTRPKAGGAFAVRIFNPDGSEAEKSGNGIRIFSRYLWDIGAVQGDEFDIETLGGRVRAIVRNSGREVQVEMGAVSFSSAQIPVAGPHREVINETVTAGDRTFTFCAATIGNPHCVIPLAEVNSALAKEYGPLLEVHPLFPRRTNVQFLRVLDRNRIQIEIWERGAGYTLASGSSSSAAAAVAYRLGLTDRTVRVQMPGGEILIEISAGFSILMTGAVTKVSEGSICDEMFEVELPNNP